jgi:hypothetical protein
MPGYYTRMGAQSWPSLAVRLAARGVVHPRRPPFLPLPDRDYLRWRMYTAYADEAAIPSAEDVIRFARWRRETMGL